METFMLLFRGSDVYQPGQSPEALQALKEEMIGWVGALTQQGLHVASEPLEPTGKYVNGARKIVTHAPFGAAKEVIGGYTIVRANDIDEAVSIAMGCPLLVSNANIEVRPIQHVPVESLKS